MIVIFEGPDGAGKDTLRRAFEKANDYVHICAVRFFISDIVYADYFKRPMFSNLSIYEKFAKKAQAFFNDNDVLVVYVTADKKVIYKRITDRGEKIESQPNFKQVEGLFDLYMRNFVTREGRVCRVNTTTDSIEKCIKQIEQKIKELPK